MQATRQLILQILHERGEATVDEIVADLRLKRGAITAVTVRHHLNKLRADGLIAFAKMRRKVSPGRPQHLYTLTLQGETRLPNNYKRLASGFLEQMAQLPERSVNVIIEGISADMAAEARIPDAPMPSRLDAVVAYLNEHGYGAHWESSADGYILHTLSCPYHELSQLSPHLCLIDMKLISKMLGVVPRLTLHMARGDDSCSYFIPSIHHTNER
ncbi:MAG: ArsR family transcriptional regulator [Anaerolineae bacterium]|nr:ArsR family transcriptional regulator [Anaerolineae bacterium]